MKNRKGFTLTEVIVVIVLIAAVTLIAVPAYNNIRSRVLESQYKNTVTLIETEALKYASSKGVSITNIQELINEGIIETDDGENLLDPRDKSSLNCRLIEIEYKDGNYSSKLIEAEECDIEKAKLDYSKIAIVKRGKESNKIYIDDTWSNEDLVLSVDVSQLPVGESIKSYRWISGTGQNSNDSTMSTNVTTITDTVVNVEVTTKSNHKYFTMSKIRVDKEKPLIKNVEVNAGNDWKTGRDITIKATDQRGSGISGYYLADAPCDGASTYKEVKKTKEMLKVESIKIYNETNYYVCVKDGAGNYTSYENNPLLLKVTDDIAPTIPEIINPSNGNWTNQNIELTVKSSDGESGLAYYEYTFNPNATSAGTDAKTTWKKSTGSNLAEHKMTFTSENDETVYIRACDNSGNCSEKNSTQIRIDKTKPSKPEIINPSNGNWTNQNIELTVKSSDGKSGLAYYEYTFNSNATSAGTDAKTTWKKSTGSNLTEHKMTFSSENNETVYIRACDNSGNCSEKNNTKIKIDKTAPSAPTAMEFVYSDWSRYTQDTWASQAVYVGYERGNTAPRGATDNLSGISYYQISSDGTNWYNYSYDITSSMYYITAEGTHTRYFRAVDNAGNVSPSMSRTAKLDLCQSTTATYGNWSSCSASCGDGIQTRTVTKKGISGKTCSSTTESQSCYLKACVTISGNIGSWVCGSSCTTSSYTGSERAHYGGSCIVDVNGRRGNVMGKVTYTASGNTVTFTYTIVQGSVTWIGTGYTVDFKIKNSSKELYSKRIKESNTSWNKGTTHTGIITYTFADPGTYYIYIDGNSTNPNFDLTFGTITVS